MQHFLDTALRYHAAGLHVIPVKDDKRPAISTWKQYQEQQTEDQVREIFSAPCHGIAVLTGVNGLEVIDVDTKYDLTGRLLTDLMRLNDAMNEDEGRFMNLVIQRTRSGGRHIIFKCPAPEGNKKLAERPASDNEDQHTTPVLLETRGVGGYIVACPTPGYEVKVGDLAAIPSISQSTRDNLIRVCRSFNQVVKMETTPTTPINGNRAAAAPTNEITPWQDYNDRNDAVDVLRSFGWSVVYETSDKVYMKRPGKTDAKTSGNYHKGKGVFVSHTSSTPLPTETGLNAFSIYTHMKHAGDFKAAARDIKGQGYGVNNAAIISQYPATLPDGPQLKEKQDKLIEFVKSTRFDIHRPIIEEDAILTVRPPDVNRIYQVGGKGMIGAVVGEQKSGKSFLLENIIGSALDDGNSRLYFSAKLKDGERICFFDTEQSSYFYSRNQARIYSIAGMNDNAEHYEAYHLRRLRVEERISAIDNIIHTKPYPAIIAIDGIVDLCRDFNSERESSEAMEHLMRWSDKTGAMILTVLHLTKSQGFMRGHLGTALQNKCDFSVEVSKDKERPGWFHVSSRDSRFTPFPKFEFLRDFSSGMLAGDDRNDYEHINNMIPSSITGDDDDFPDPPF